MLNIFGMQVPRSVVFRGVGLVVFLVIMAVATALLWPLIASVFSEEGRANLVGQIRHAGPMGVLMLLGLEFIQIIVAFIPGEVVQMVAGMLYGPWLGAAIVLGGCVLATWAIYELVHRLGQPFVEEVVSTEHLERFREFEANGKLEAMVFILFLIPGLPKDVFTYLVPLTSMSRGQYLLLTTIARSPGVLMSTFAASGLARGNYVQSVIVFAIVAILAIVGIYHKDRLLGHFGRTKD
jgi:uncharacterized membrane protein YdjX (TVP38/TMEM64 family)